MNGSRREIPLMQTLRKRWPQLLLKRKPHHQRDHPLHPYLIEGLLVIVNRRRKTPFHFEAKPWWQQPLYIIVMRDESYLACCCAVENGLPVIHPCSREFHRSVQYRLHRDAEVIGQVVAIARKLV
jgi:hypothetical protein